MDFFAVAYAHSSHMSIANHSLRHQSSSKLFRMDTHPLVLKDVGKHIVEGFTWRHAG
jgi:hypothetical protein